MSSDSVSLLERAARAAAVVVDGIGPAQWSNETPCEDMGVHALVQHMIGGLEQFTEVARGRELDPNAQRSVPTASAAGEYRAAGETMASAWSEPGLVEREFPMPWGPTPGSTLVEFMVIEELTHGWDLARATGQGYTVDDDLAEATLELARRYDDESIRVPGMFGPEVSVDDSAPAIDRLAAFLGRRP